MNRIGIYLALSLAVLVSGVGVAQTPAPAQTKASAYETGLRRFLAIAQSADATVADADYIVALVNDDIITHHELKARWDRLQAASPGKKIPAEERSETLYRLMDELVAERLYAQAAKQAAIVVEESAVENAVASVARQNDLTPAQLKEQLSKEGLAYDVFKSRIASQLLLQKLRDRFTDTRPSISDQAIEAEMARFQPGVVLPNLQVNLAHLLIPVPEDASAEQEKAAQALAQSVAQRARSGADFVQLATMRENRAPVGDAKGMGLRELDNYPTLFADAVATVPVGGVAGPIKSGAGYHVLKVVEKKESPLVLMSVTESRVRHVLIRASTSREVEQATVELATLRDEIVRGKMTFAQAAKAVSQDASAQTGGDLGWATPGLFVPEFEKPMMQLPLGQVSSPIVSRFGVHLIEVVDRREARMPRSVLRDRVQGYLREAKAEESFKTWNQELRGGAYIEWREAPRL